MVNGKRGLVLLALIALLLVPVFVFTGCQKEEAAAEDEAA